MRWKLSVSCAIALVCALPCGAARQSARSYRDPDATFCPRGTFNITNGVAVVW